MARLFPQRNPVTRRLAAIAAAVALLAVLAPRHSARAEVPVPALSTAVTDLSGVLSSADASALETTLRQFEQRKGSQVGVLILPTTQPETIEQFGIRVAEQWKLGRKGVDDGAILIVATQDRTLRIEVGYGLEGALPDATANRIIEDVIVPRFKQGDMPGGIRAGVESMLKVIDGEPLPEPQRGGGRGDFHVGDVGNIAFFALFALFGAGWILRAIFGRMGGAAVGAGILGALGWFITGAALIAIIAAVVGFLIFAAGGAAGVPGRGLGRRRGGFGGFGGGGFGGGGGGGFGGFSGGGGGFGGGGASGRW